MTSNGTSAVSRPGRLGRLRQGHLHHHGGDDAFGAGGGIGRRRDRLHAPLCRLRQAVPDAGFLPDLRSVPAARHRSRLAHLSRPQGGAFRLFLRALGDHSVRFQGAWLCRRVELGPCRISLSGILHRAVRHAVVHLFAADLLRGHEGDATRSATSGLGYRSNAGDGSCLDRLDRDRRIRRALCVFLHRLPVCRCGIRAV